MTLPDEQRHGLPGVSIQDILRDIVTTIIYILGAFAVNFIKARLFDEIPLEVTLFEQIGNLTLFILMLWMLFRVVNGFYQDIRGSTMAKDIGALLGITSVSVQRRERIPSNISVLESPGTDTSSSSDTDEPPLKTSSKRTR
jgi:hypothetical protein